MSLRALLVLMVAFLVLGTFAFFDPLRRQEKEGAKQDRESHVVWLKDKKLERLQVTGKGPVVWLECAVAAGCPFDGTGEWKVTKPSASGGDASAIATLASTILNLSHSERLDFETAPDLVEFGLDKPQAEVMVVVKGESDPYILQVGKAAAVGASVYLSVNRAPKTVFLVPSYIPAMFQKDDFHWRNKRLFPKLESSHIERLRWKAGALRVDARKQDGHWQLDAPVRARASDMMLEGLVSTVVYAAAKSVYAPLRTSPEAKKVLRGKPEIELELTMEGGDPQRLQLFAKGEAKPGAAPGTRELVAALAGNDSLFTMDGTQFDRFQKSLLEYRRRSVLDGLDRPGVDQVKFSFPREKQEISLRLQEGQWVVAAGEKLAESLSQKRVNSLLDGLRDSDFKATYPAKGASPSAQAFRTQPADVELTLEANGKSLGHWRFLVRDRKVALTEEEGEVKELAASFLKVLPVRLPDLYESNNKQVVISPAGEGKETGDGHDHSSSHDH